jgi:hypothetical protein
VAQARVHLPEGDPVGLGVDELSQIHIANQTQKELILMAQIGDCHLIGKMLHLKKKANRNQGHNKRTACKRRKNWGQLQPTNPYLRKLGYQSV